MPLAYVQQHDRLGEIVTVNPPMNRRSQLADDEPQPHCP
jgi:hypothetical protein